MLLALYVSKYPYVGFNYFFSRAIKEGRKSITYFVDTNNRLADVIKANSRLISRR